MGYAEFPHYQSQESELSFLISVYKELRDNYRFIENTVRDVNIKLQEYMADNNHYVDRRLQDVVKAMDKLVLQVKDDQKFFYDALEGNTNARLNRQDSILKDMDINIQEIATQTKNSLAKQDMLIATHTDYINDRIALATSEFNVKINQTTADLMRQIGEVRDMVANLPDYKTDVAVKNPVRNNKVTGIQDAITDLYEHAVVGMGYDGKAWHDDSGNTAGFIQDKNIDAITMYTAGRDRYEHDRDRYTMFNPLTGKNEPITKVVQDIFNHFNTGAIAAGEYDNRQYSAGYYDSQNITAGEYDLNGKDYREED